MKLSRAGGCGVAVVMFATSLLLTPSSNAQTNSWTNSVSGNWEDSSWSLGQLPGAGQTVLLTNAGFKAVQIRQNTATHFPQTLTVDSLIISSPTNSLNTLLMNFVGVGSPLTVNSLTLNANSDFTMHSSALLVQSNLSIGGTFNQNDFSGVTAANMQVGDLGPAQYTMSNGTLTVTNHEYIGSSNNYPVSFDQEGGYHFVGQLWITNGAIYDLNSGQLGGDLHIQHGILIQNGGDLAPSSNFSDQGSYTLMDGTLEAPNGMSLTDNAFADQWGGTNTASALVMGTTDQEILTGGTYTLVDGTMNLGSATINYLGDLDQQGGAINVGTLNIPDFLFGPNVHSVWGNYSQEGGQLSASTINLAGHITQTGGTNTVTGNLNLQDGPADYIMTGGFLSTSNTLKTGGAFHQTNGVHAVQNLLQIDNPLAYDMAGGQLIAPFIQIDNSTMAHWGGSVSNSAVLIMNFGWWIERTPSVQLGRLRVTGSSLPSTLSIATNPCTIHFIGSSGQVWSNNVTFQIGGWAGSLTGGGQSQVFFGNNSSGLSASQLAHVQFTFSQGNLPAKILPSGEVVPLVTGLPFFPTDLTATAFGSNRVELGWTDNAINEYGYDIERSLDGTNFAQICATEANVTNYTDTGVTAATTYYYKVRALNTNGNSDFSNIASATTMAPLSATLNAQPNGAMQLNFHGPSQRSYEIDISSDLAYWIPWTTQFNDTGTFSLTDDSATNAPTRYYRITLLP